MTASPRSLLALACACVCAAIVVLPTAAASATRLGSAPTLPAGSRIVSAVAADTPMHVTLTLQPRDPAALQAFADAVSTPGSPLYREYITPAQFAQRFGPPGDAVQAVESSLRAHDLSPGQPSANGLSIPVSATAGALARAFSVSFAHATMASGTTAIVNQQAPSLDPGVAPAVQAVLGLDTLSAARPLLVRAHTAGAARAHVVTAGPQPCAAAAAAAASQGGLTADQIASAYGLSGLYQAGNLAAGQTIAVLELEPYDPNDITAYQQCYGATAPVAAIPVDGGAGGGSGSGEAALDIENMIGLAPQANIAVYEGPNAGAGPYDTFSTMISQRAAQVITASWGQCEPLNGSRNTLAENTLFQEAAAQGQSIISASGDDGAEDCFPTRPTAEVDDPASQPYVTGVGGTRLSAAGPPPSESVWNDGPTIGAGGGGISSFWKMPAYQANAPAALHVIGPKSSGSRCGASSGYCREVPDVSANADPATGYLIYWNGSGAAEGAQLKGWQVVGGTSGAAPAWAALIALANASPACKGTAVGFANPALYNAAATAYAGNFNDITSGNNDMTGVNGGQFTAGVRYDMATGLGSPNGTVLAATLCADAIALSNPGPQRSILGSSVRLQIKAADTRRAPVRFTAAGLPRGLSINASSGQITGRPRHVETSKVTVTVDDAAGTRSQASFAWTIQTKPSLSDVSLTGVGVARPRLSFTLVAGRSAPPLKTVAVALPRAFTFSRSHAAISVTGRGRRHLGFSADLQKRTLVLKLGSAASQVRVTIAYPQLQASSGLAAQVAGHRAPRLTLTVKPADALKRTTWLTARLNPS
ncbi:MAG: putative Ig domain-containing protein [Solirubrobacterales bacterium]|nr:putative Ig domain-containing protein [Solirubrobacterales bacterium]